MLLKMALDDAADKELIKKNFLESIKEPKSKKYSEAKQKDLKDEEIKLILNAVKDNPMLNTMVNIMLCTGMRPGEVLALRFDDVDFDRKTINVNRALSYIQDVDIVNKRPLGTRTPIIKEVKNEHSGRTLSVGRTLKVSANLLNIITEWKRYIETKPVSLSYRKSKETEGYLFKGVNGNIVLADYYMQVYERHLEKKGLKYSEYYPYRFRHNFCTRLLRHGVDPKTVMMLMGDNTLDMVLKVYASINKEDMLKASSEFSEIMDCTLEEVM